MAKRKQNKRQKMLRALPLLRLLGKPAVVCEAQGHMKLSGRFEAKTYRAVLRFNGEARWSKRDFRRAEAAETYGRKLSARVCRMVSLSQALTPALTPALSQGERESEA